MKLDERSYQFLKTGIENSIILKSVAIINCNLTKSAFVKNSDLLEKTKKKTNMLHIITEGMMESKSLECIDV